MSAGASENVEVTINYPFVEGESYVAMLHAETNGNDTCDFGPGTTEQDNPTVTNGQAVVSTFSGSSEGSVNSPRGTALGLPSHL